MQFKETLVRLILIFLPACCFSQTTFLPQGDKSNTLLERLEIKAGTDSLFNFSKTKPFSREHIIKAAQSYWQHSGSKMSAVDAHNLKSLFLNNLEYLPAADRSQYNSKKPIGKSFYRSPANLYEVHVKDFDLAVNPVIQYTISKENNNSQRLFLNTRGLHVRGRIANKIGFFAYLTDNQERSPQYVQQFISARRAVPGNGFYKPFKAAGGVDYFDARGYFTFGVSKYINIAFGYDKNFIGNGQRSLLLSDFGNNTLFLKLNTRIWKINYQNLFMELYNAHVPGGDKLIGKKYAAMHHLDVGVTKWLNIGLFEGVIFGRKDRFEFGYLNPRAATHIVMTQFPGLQLKPDIATESMMELANVFRGDFAKRQGWGWHYLDSWRLFLKTIKDIGQISTDIHADYVIKNDYVAGANTFDMAKVKADAEGYDLPDDYKAVDVEAIRARL